MGGLVSGVGSLLGGGPNNSQFQAQTANLYNPTNDQQIQNAYSQTQGNLAQQQGLVNALAAQNGIQNQSNVFSQLQGVADGTGPNPAAAQLALATGQNTANQAALMAGQRGTGANAGLLARQAAQQGAANQQNAAGQAAALQAQQSLSALGQMGGLATQQVGQQQNSVNALNQFGQNEQQQLLGANQGYTANQVGMQGNVNSANASLAAKNADKSGGFLGGALNGIGAAIPGLFTGSGGSGGGDGTLFAGGGGDIGSLASTALMFAAEGGEVPNPKAAQVPAGQRFEGALAPHVEHLAQIYHPHFATGGKVAAMVSPGEVYLPPEKAKAVAKDGKNPLKEGEKIPGKPKKPGNNYENDVVKKDLKPGGVVIPNSIMQSDDPAGNAAEFVKKLVEKNGSKEHGDFKEALKKAIASRKAS